MNLILLISSFHFKIKIKFIKIIYSNRQGKRVFLSPPPIRILKTIILSIIMKQLKFIYYVKIKMLINDDNHNIPTKISHVNDFRRIYTPN